MIIKGVEINEGDMIYLKVKEGRIFKKSKTQNYIGFVRKFKNKDELYKPEDKIDYSKVSIFISQNENKSFIEENLPIHLLDIIEIKKLKFGG